MIIFDLLVMFILAVASGCGVGGGGLLVVYLTLVKNVGQTAAQAVNLLFYIISAVSSTAFGGLGGDRDGFRAGLFCAGIAIPGAYLGSIVRGNISDSALRAVFGLLLVAAGVTMGISSIKKLRTERRKNMAKQ